MKRRGPLYDTVYQWTGAAWREVPPAEWPYGVHDAANAARILGADVLPGSTTIGPPEGPPGTYDRRPRKRS